MLCCEVPRHGEICRPRLQEVRGTSSPRPSGLRRHHRDHQLQGQTPTFVQHRRRELIHPRVRRAHHRPRNLRALPLPAPHLRHRNQGQQQRLRRLPTSPGSLRAPTSILRGVGFYLEGKERQGSSARALSEGQDEEAW
jgi:hypothetical protein